MVLESVTDCPVHIGAGVGIVVLSVCPTTVIVSGIVAVMYNAEHGSVDR